MGLETTFEKFSIESANSDILLRQLWKKVNHLIIDRLIEQLAKIVLHQIPNAGQYHNEHPHHPVR
jgi:hypothetical protein